MESEIVLCFGRNDYFENVLFLGLLCLTGVQKDVKCVHYQKQILLLM